MPLQALILGGGYLGGRVAAALHAAGGHVTALTRSPTRADEFRRRGWSAVVGDVLDPATLTLPPSDLVVSAVGYDRAAGRPPWDTYVTGLAHVLDRLPPPGRFVYVGSTGVYGQTDGSEVDEDAPADPTDEAGRAVLEAERLLQKSEARTSKSEGRPGSDFELRISDFSPVILRFAGIYGPGRLLRAASLRAGEAVPGDPDAWLNLIHVDDGVRAVLAAARHATPGRVYNVSDGRPVRRRAFFTELARLLSAPPPRFEGAAAGRAANRRIVSRRLRAELGMEPAYPSYVEGLAQSVAAGGAAG